MSTRNIQFAITYIHYTMSTHVGCCFFLSVSQYLSDAPYTKNCVDLLSMSVIDEQQPIAWRNEHYARFTQKWCIINALASASHVPLPPPWATVVANLAYTISFDER